MNEYIGELTLDLDCRKTMPKIAVGQYDKGRKYLIHITANGVQFSAVDSTVVLQGVRSNKTRFSVACTVDGSGNVVLVLNESVLSSGGFAYAKLVLSDANKNYSTQVFIIDVDGSYEGDISSDENYSIVNDFINRMMVLYGLESQNNLGISDVIYENVQLTGNTDYPNIDTAIKNNVIYRVFDVGNNSPIGWAVFCGSKNYVNVPASQFLCDRNGNIKYRTGTANSGTVNWSNTWNEYMPSNRTIAGLALSNDISVAALSEALADEFVSSYRTIAGIGLSDDISSDDLADALWNDIGIDEKANLFENSAEDISSINPIKKGQYYFSSERGVIGVKLSVATPSTSSQPPRYIEAYDTDTVDGMVPYIIQMEPVSAGSNNLTSNVTVNRIILACFDLQSQILKRPIYILVHACSSSEFKWISLDSVDVTASGAPSYTFKAHTFDASTGTVSKYVKTLTGTDNFALDMTGTGTVDSYTKTEINTMIGDIETLLSQV